MPRGKLHALAIRKVLRALHLAAPRLRRLHRFRGMTLYIPPGVFIPVWAVSTDLIIEYMRPRGLVVEVGCGSGAISIAAAKHPGVARVVAYDQNPLAVAVTRVNARLNGVGHTVYATPWVEKLPLGEADYAVVNPPYLPLDLVDALDTNWCGGSNLEVLRRTIGLAAASLRRGGVLITAVSSVTRLGRALAILEEEGLKPKVLASRRTPALDRVYVIKALRV